MSDLWFVEIEQLKSLGFRESHLKRWIHYFKNSRIYLVQVTFIILNKFYMYNGQKHFL